MDPGERGERKHAPSLAIREPIVFGFCALSASLFVGVPRIQDHKALRRQNVGKWFSQGRSVQALLSRGTRRSHCYFNSTEIISQRGHNVKNKTKTSLTSPMSLAKPGSGAQDQSNCGPQGHWTRTEDLSGGHHRGGARHLLDRGQGCC